MTAWHRSRILAVPARSGADLVAVHGLGGRGVSAGVTIVADGNPATAERLKRVLDGDPRPDGDETTAVEWFAPDQLGAAELSAFTVALFEAVGVSGV